MNRGRDHPKGGSMVQRFDNVAFKATKTDEGFIRDSPIVGRTGILVYRNADGTERREYRPPEEAFKADSLASLMGKPITIGHKAFVTAGNAAKVAPVGSVLSAGRQDGNAIRADIVIYNLDTDARELSCGYSLNLDETSGITPEGEHYDAIQRNIVYNHVALVPQGRAGIARLNMDGSQIIDDERNENDMAEMTKIRLDSGIEYECAPEVKVEIEKMRKDSAEAQKEQDKLQAKFDALEAELKKEQEGRKADAEAHKANFDEAVKARVELLKVAEAHKVADADSMTDTEIKTAVIKAVRGGAINLDGKSADYIEAAFDMAKADIKQHEDGMAEQRKATQTHDDEGAQENNDAADDPEAAYQKLIEAERHMYEKGRE